MNEALWIYSIEEQDQIAEYLAVSDDQAFRTILLISASVWMLKPSSGDSATQSQEAARGRHMRKLRKSIDAVIADIERLSEDDVIRDFAHDVVPQLQFISALLPSGPPKRGGVILRRNANLAELVAYLAKVWVSHRNEPPKIGFNVKHEKVTGAFCDFVHACTRPVGFTIPDSVLRSGVKNWRNSLKTLK